MCRGATTLYQAVRLTTHLLGPNSLLSLLYISMSVVKHPLPYILVVFLALN